MAIHEKMEVTKNYISCACNSHSHSVDWGKNNLICYASFQSIVIYNPDAGDTGKVVETLHIHPSPIKTIHWIETDGCDPESEIISSSLDGTIIIWTKNENSYEQSCSIKTHDQLTMAQAFYLNKTVENKSLLISGAFSNAQLPVWQTNASGEIVNKQELNLNKKIPINMKFLRFPGSGLNIPGLIITTDDFKIHLYAWNVGINDSKMNFVHIKELKGHQDWIQCLDVMQSSQNECMIASGSQDGTIRLWKLGIIDTDQILDEITTQFMLDDHHFYVSLESVLNGHDHWVYGLHWHPPVVQDDGSIQRPLKLLSTALDTTMLIWEPGINGLWVETVKLGRIGGNSVGYYGCKFSSDGFSVLAHGYQGTFHMWKYQQNIKKWIPRAGPSGHHSEVTDLAWDVAGRYLISTSLDQTTRIHVPWRMQHGQEVWHEFSRPQIHGYDINALAILSPLKFASGADEKVVRIFEAPSHFARILETGVWKNPKGFKESASVPALGLTNKVVGNNQELKDEEECDVVEVDRPPTEEEIIRHTLWPELEKLYGHGYEIFAMAATHTGKFLATACKSTSQEHAAIIIWSMKSFSQIQKLISHRLTITQLAFSPDDKYLVSVSRDRRWGLYGLSDDNVDENAGYKIITMSSGANSLHSRIIWCCNWTHDSKYFATGSRDGKIGLWNVNELKHENNKGPVASLNIKDTSVTALAFSHKFIAPNTYILAVGFDNGVIDIKKIIDKKTSFDWICCGTLNTSTAHHATVKRLAFRPGNRPELLELASCSSDRAVKIYNLNNDDLIKCKSE